MFRVSLIFLKSARDEKKNEIPTVSCSSGAFEKKNTQEGGKKINKRCGFEETAIFCFGGVETVQGSGSCENI